MAAPRCRLRPVEHDHHRTRIIADPRVVLRAVLTPGPNPDVHEGEQLAGYLVVFDRDGQRDFTRIQRPEISPSSTARR